MAENDALLEKLEQLRQRYNEVNDLIVQPDIIQDQARYIRLNREYKELKELVDATDRYIKLKTNLEDAKQVLDFEKDPELKELARAELDEGEVAMEKLVADIRQMLIPKDPEDARFAVLEIREEPVAMKPPFLQATFGACISATAIQGDGVVKLLILAKAPPVVTKKSLWRFRPKALMGF